MRMKPRDKDENAKDPRWKIPMNLPGVKPEDYPDAAGSVTPGRRRVEKPGHRR